MVGAVDIRVLAVERTLVVLSVALASVLFNAAFKSKKRVSNWLGVFVLAMGQIVLASEILSELKAISLFGFFCLQLIFLALSIWAVRKTRSTPEFSDFFPSRKEVVDFSSSNRLLVLFGVCVVVILVLFILPNESIPGDAAHYHLARAQYWIQNQTARHFYTDDYRQVDFPPNTSFLSMWQILVSGSYSNLNLFQWIAALLAGLAVFGLSRQAGHDVAKSAFAGLAYLTLSSVVLQMSTPVDDNLTAWLAVSLVYFVFLAIKEVEPGWTDAHSRQLLQGGIAFGLLMGSKLTAAFMMPAFGLVVIVWLLKVRSSFIRRSIQMGLVLFAGFLVFGSYNYLLNWLDFGNPVASPAAFRQAARVDLLSSQGQAVTSSAWNPAANIVRYAYQIMDWQIVSPIPGANVAFLVHRYAYREMGKLLHLNLEGVSRFNLTDIGMRDIIPGADVGYGPIGYLIFLGSIVLLPIAIWRFKRSPAYRYSIAFIALGLGWLVLFSFLIPWAPAKVRYFSISFVFFVPAVVPFVYDKRRLAYLWILPGMVLALWTLGRVSNVARTYSSTQPSLSEWQATLLSRVLPPAARIGTSGTVDFIYYLRAFPEYSFTPIPPETIADRLGDGSLDAVLADDPSSDLDRFWLPFEHGQSLLVDNPKLVLLSNLDLYGVTLHSSGSRWSVELKNSGLIQRLGPDLVRIFIPATGPVTAGGPLHAEIAFPVEPPGPDALSLACGGTQDAFQIEGSAIMADLPAPTLSQDQAYLYCEVRISDYGFGNQVPSSSILVTVESQAQP